ncbi:AMP-binding protein [Rhodopseudomonas sp. HC1]|uniref:AMP-binding protein n=1 Tax=Rhodopseudomonas infernalis TaxID=2897386 RepID=UPI001EE87080|nr:AMP-binding protein [Rhodopseudomonas infernalis]MCG6203609.1 AMP-binding protein [Rhodopseudomonas infernalis]
MAQIETAYHAFIRACESWPDRPFLADISRARSGVTGEVTFAAARRRVDEWIERFEQAGYGGGHRVGVLLGNDPDHFVINLALNAIGASIVPLSLDATSHELAYVIDHSEAALIVHGDAWTAHVTETLSRLTSPPPTMLKGDVSCPAAGKARNDARPNALTEASLLYTSGTTGRPKGCILTNAYYLRLGRAYVEAGGAATIRAGEERILNPLPVSHQNAGIFSFMCAVLSGSCILLTDRFHASTWWQQVAHSRATIIHYLGVMPAILLKLPKCPEERSHGVRFGIGAGVEPSLHQPFEQRFGFPLIELWGMTEVGCGFIASDEPRQVGSRAVGTVKTSDPDQFEVRLVDDGGNDVAVGETGELLVRKPGADPSKDMFAGYLKDPAATAAAWQGGWFHTGDAFRQDAAGTLFFVERRKNIIRRSGENIAAAEVETVLLDHARVARTAVIAVKDEIRDEEVFACIVVKDGSADAALAEELFDWCKERLAYYKAPGWIVFLDDIPVTSTQKVQKSTIFASGEEPRHHPNAIDLRALKKRDASSRSER